MKHITGPSEVRLHSVAVMIAVVIAIACGGFGHLHAQVVEASPEELQRMGVDEHSGSQIPLDELRFVSDTGDSIGFGQFFYDDKPVVLTLYYSDCPMLCSLVLNGLHKAVSQVDFTPGIDYRLLTVSIDPRQTVAQSAAGVERFATDLPGGVTSGAWRFFTGDSVSIRLLTEAVGFRYFYVEERNEYAHPALAIVLTPEGRISRYLYGIEFKPADLKLALLEASAGKIGTTIDRILLYCYHYDPNAKGYVLMAGQIMKLGGAFTLFIFGGLLAGLWLKDRRKSDVR